MKSTGSQDKQRLNEKIIEQEVEILGEDVWAVLARGRLPEGCKNRFVLLPELAQNLPPKDYEGENPWNVRPNNPWKASDRLKALLKETES